MMKKERDFFNNDEYPCHDNFYGYLEEKGMLIESIFSQFALTLDKNSIDPETSSLLSIYPLV